MRQKKEARQVNNFFLEFTKGSPTRIESTGDKIGIPDGRVITAKIHYNGDIDRQVTH